MLNLGDCALKTFWSRNQSQNGHLKFASQLDDHVEEFVALGSLFLVSLLFVRFLLLNLLDFLLNLLMRLILLFDNLVQAFK